MSALISDWKRIATNHFDDVQDTLCALNRWLYEHPELSDEEGHSSRRVAQVLEEVGFAVELGAYEELNGFAARIGDAGPEVVICAEYDALPGVGHGCGHNIISAAAVGAGAALLPLAAALDFRVTVLGTPAEERRGGKVDMIGAGAFAEAAAAMMVHPSTQDVLDPTMISIAEFEASFHGRAAHASAHPQAGINALDAVVQAYVNISTLRQSLYPTDKIHGIIDHGGDAPNIVPDHTHSVWYVRAATAERLDEVIERFQAAFQAAAVATGCRLDLDRVGNVMEHLVSNQTLARLFAENSNALGRPMSPGATVPADQAGSTDMGNVSHVVPTIHPMLDIDAYPAVNHQREFADATVEPAGVRAIRDGALAMAYTVIDLAEQELWDEL